MRQAITALDNDVFSAPDVSLWHLAKKFSTLEFYKPVKQLVDLLAEMSKSTVALKGGENVLQSLQQHLVAFEQAASAMQVCFLFFFPHKIKDPNS